MQFDRKPGATRTPDTQRRRMIATKKHESVCPGCREEIRRGDEFVNVPRGTRPRNWHARCYGGVFPVTVRFKDGYQ